jgi:hypothetical protein
MRASEWPTEGAATHLVVEFVAVEGELLRGAESWRR